jgi:geranylgeranyl diphosphate synthase type II
VPNCESLRTLIENGLQDFLPLSRLECNQRLNDAVHYAVFPGGKRMRPILTLLGARIAGVRTQDAVPAACAVEFLHTSSLIFDDLPSMDDAALRRGSAALHLVFGEDIALLAALSLLNQAYALFGTTTTLLAEAVACIGVNGMIGGQALDLAAKSDDGVSFTARNRKTSALMRLTLVAGAMACRAPEDAIDALARAGENLGEAYQVCDDLLDQFMVCEHTGKTVQQDARHQRPSHAAAFGPTACHEYVSGLVDQARRTLEMQFGHTEEVAALLSNVDQIMSGFRRAGLVTACS